MDAQTHFQTQIVGALPDHYRLTGGQLNDDRLGWVLERINAHAGDVQAPLVLKTIERLGLDVRQIHSDLTTVELYGAYEGETDEGQPSSNPTPTPIASSNRHGGTPTCRRPKYETP